MSEIKVNSIVDASGGSTVQVNGYTPTVSNMAGRNRIINGDMRIDQRNAGASKTITTGDWGGKYVTDRWGVYKEMPSATITGQQVSDAPTGFSQSLKVTVSTASAATSNQQFYVVHAIEGYNFADFGFGSASAADITLSFWVKASVTGTYATTLRNESATLVSYVATFDVAQANTWEKKTITISGATSGNWSTTNTVGLFLFFDLGSVGTFIGSSPNTWETADRRTTTGAVNLSGVSGATFYITGVQLEEGSVATPFEHRQYGQELALCQRYFYMLARGNSINFAASNYWGTSEIDAYISFKVSMRASPTAYQVTGTNYFDIDRVSGDSFDGFVGIVRSNENGGMLYAASGVSGTDGFAAQIRTNNANAVIAFQAEL